ncbi:ATP:cob(I)alamin adenosyltransferase [Niabella ginsenosidivorans]|uniref:Corrinoid adenosyltransferase n=1 Tax=Niabella ginsenosidivorans TaxID=1176587 RepID=A0A1A9I6G2_9BACT|nr:cob(I)yrinic acid a,c-diamide adenosyltransferase [Niabella ginsenosidivorans]ANH82242.1 ATP:cob(I)alamin adenosyltransferase [Niabella ginsenosidivorans]
MSFRIYTKTGDKGTTVLIGGTKVSKAHLRIESYGNADELNAYIGLCRDLLPDIHTKEILREVQDRLFTIGSVLAQDPGKKTKMALPDLHKEDIQLLEKEIDAMTEKLPAMQSFILPGGSIPVAQLHIARCVCRRTERSVVRLAEESPVEAIVLSYLNRLSDYLFVLARYTAWQSGITDIPWKPRI